MSMFTDLAKVLAELKLDTIFILGGLGFTFIAVVGDISGKISPGNVGRAISAVVAILLFAGGIWIHMAQPQSPPQPSPVATPSPPPQPPPVATPSPPPQPSPVATPSPPPQPPPVATPSPPPQPSSVSLKLRPDPKQPLPGIECFKTDLPPIDRLICADADLAEWDGKMSEEFRKKLAGKKNPGEFQRDQTEWWTRRRDQCLIPKTGNQTALQLAAGKSCVLKMTKDRYDELQSK
jgi:uncharacterized protein YecT (DUF1311 family)